MSADHPRDMLRKAARRGVVPQEERDRSDLSTRAGDAIRDAARRSVPA